MLNKLLSFLVLPPQITAFEANYLKKMNRLGFLFFALHVPVFMVIAYFNGTGALWAFVLTSLLLLGPAVAAYAFDNPRSLSLVYGFTAMLMGGLLVHFGQGPVQIEMHFYFFALLAMLAVYGNPMVIVVAAVTVALHHLCLWAWLPASVFNYDAPIWVVLVHAAFVVLESVATCYIARSFFDNVIGLEKIVEARTKALDARNQDMRLVLDNVHEGFLTVDRALCIASERSRVVDEWLGAIAPGTTLPEVLEAYAPRVAASLRFGWEEVLADVMPLELTLAQLPNGFAIGDRHFGLAYRPIMAGGQLEKLLVVISDATAERAHERLELEQRDVMQILGRLGKDKSGVLEFFSESGEQVKIIAEQRPADAKSQKRIIHTLKGNAMIFGVQAIAKLCERFESDLDESGALPSAEDRVELAARWAKLCESLDMLLGERRQKGLELDDHEYEEVLSAVLRGEPSEVVAGLLRNWRLEPTIKRLGRVGEQARALAQRMGKGTIRVEIADHRLRLESSTWAPFWSAFVHVVRNAVDHGLEAESERLAAGKPQGTIGLTTRHDGAELVIELSDDGRGVDWEKVAGRARDLGLSHATRADLVEALFADGLSTRDLVSEVSGRGVGMSAMRSACVALGGAMQVLDREGGGTVVAFRFPRSIERQPRVLLSA